jgi:hypothetical protein
MASDRNQCIVDAFRTSQGRVGGYFEGHTLLIVHTLARDLTARG